MSVVLILRPSSSAAHSTIRPNCILFYVFPVVTDFPCPSFASSFCTLYSFTLQWLSLFSLFIFFSTSFFLSWFTSLPFFFLHSDAHFPLPLLPFFHSSRCVHPPYLPFLSLSFPFSHAERSAILLCTNIFVALFAQCALPVNCVLLQYCTPEASRRWCLIRVLNGFRTTTSDFLLRLDRPRQRQQSSMASKLNSERV